MNKKKPPIIVFVSGTSLIPNKGNHTQKIPPITSVKDNKVNSAAGIILDTIDYNIRKTWYNITKMYNRTAVEYMGSMALAMIVLNIDMFEGTPSTQLGPTMGMESTSLSRSLKKLEELGIINRIHDKKDKRKTKINVIKIGL